MRCATLHSNRSQNQRLRALKDFKDGAVRVLVATDIAARGIDVDGISHVVNYDFPMHPEDYVHRIGRTGRAHAVGDAISFVTHRKTTANCARWNVSSGAASCGKRRKDSIIRRRRRSSIRRMNLAVFNRDKTVRSVRAIPARSIQVIRSVRRGRAGNNVRSPGRRAAIARVATNPVFPATHRGNSGRPRWRR